MSHSPRPRLERAAAPATVAGLVTLAVMVYVCAGYGFNVSALLLVGGKDSPYKAEWFHKGTVVYRDIAGYDGAAYYLVALDPILRNPSLLPKFKQQAVLRYQRVGFTALAHVLSLGRPRAIPWAMALINLMSVALGTWLLARLLVRHGRSPWWAMAFGLSPGVLFSATYCLTEPLSLCLAAAALLLYDREQLGWCWLALAAGLLVRETVVLFAAGLAAYELTQKRWLRVALFASASAPSIAFQAWLCSKTGAQLGSSAAFAFTYPFGGMWAELGTIPSAPGLMRLMREASVAPFMALVVASFGFALWTTIKLRSPYVACLGAVSALMLIGYQDWWSTFVNATRVGSGLFLALPAVLVHGETKFAEGLLWLGAALAAMGLVRILIDAHQAYWLVG